MKDRAGQVWEFCDDRSPTLTIIIVKTLGRCIPVHLDVESWKHRAFCIETGSVSTWWEPVYWPYEERNDRQRLA